MPGTCLGVIPIEAGVVAIGVIQVHHGVLHDGLLKGQYVIHCTVCTYKMSWISSAIFIFQLFFTNIEKQIENDIFGTSD